MNPGIDTLPGLSAAVSLKALFCFALAGGSLILLRLFQDRLWELRALRYGVVIGIAAKFLIAVWLYGVLHPVTLNSDATLYYLPQTDAFLKGAIPNRDFASSYSILFLPLLSPAVWLWHSVGAIALTMLVLETLTLRLYLGATGSAPALYRWRAALLYTFSPISFYWAAVSGHNGVVIAFFTMTALVLANRGGIRFAGVAAALSFLCSKLLALLSWPAIVFWNVRGWRKAILAPVAALAVMAVLPLFGIDVLMPLKHEFDAHTSGNLWFLASVIFPRLRHTPVWLLLPLLTFVPFFLMFFRRYVTGNDRLDSSSRFNAAAAMIAGTNLLFMIFSHKSYSFYTTMFLVFLVHSLVGRAPCRWLTLIPLAFLGATTTLEGALWLALRATNYHLGQPMTRILFSLDAAIIACYLYYVAICWKLLRPERIRDTQTVDAPQES